MSSFDWEAVAAQQTFMLLGERWEHLKLANAVLDGNTGAAHSLAQRQNVLAARMVLVDRHHAGSCGSCGRIKSEHPIEMSSLQDQLGIMAQRVHSLKDDLAEARAHNEGRDARQRNVAFGDCPYHPTGASPTSGIDVAKGAAWRNGWLDAERDELLKGIARAARNYRAVACYDQRSADAYLHLETALGTLEEHDVHYGGEFTPAEG